MYNVLVIDDERSFLPDKTPLSKLLVYARDATTAVEMLRKHVFEIVYFDHDLGPNSAEIRDVFDAIDAFDLAGENTHIGRAVVHTANPVGGNFIVSRLNDLMIPNVRVAAIDIGLIKG